MVRVVTDSTADIPADMVAALGITVIPSYVVFGAESYRDEVELTKQEFYEKLRSTGVIPTTAAPPPAVYDETYRRLAKETKEIVSIHLASRYSVLYSSAVLAAKNVSDAQITVLDSEQVTMGYGWMVVAAAEAAQGGASVEHIVTLVEGMKPRSHVVAVLDTLEFLHRGGRVGWIRAMIGTLLRVKPIIEVRQSEIQLVERARTMQRALGRLVERVQALGSLERAIILHADAAEMAQRVSDLWQAADPRWEPLIHPAGVTIASHVGPGAVGIACVTQAQQN